MCNLPRNEYPRPQLVRDSWINLNGEWDFSFDTDVFDRVITVPFAPETKLSGIDSRDHNDILWYRKYFTLPDTMKGKNILLHFGAVDYYCRLWVNGQFVMEHTGGHVGFHADITEYVYEGENEIKLFVKDHIDELDKPRGKQYWEKESKSIFYTRTTGVWQTVWIEAVNKTYISKLLMTPDIDNMAVNIDIETIGRSSSKLEIKIKFGDTLIAEATENIVCNKCVCSIGLTSLLTDQCEPIHLLWTPETPNLFDISFALREDDIVIDNVMSYFGMRKVSIVNGQFLLNNCFYYQKLILDQGYWEESLLTAPDDKAFVNDIRLVKEMGFNGVRKHQKIEDPRFLYHADRMGLLVWGEMANAFAYSQKYIRRITDEWIDAIMRDYNHPAIIVWTPINESWGIPDVAENKEMQSHSEAMVHLTKSLDSTRPVISNDGWEHTSSDLFTIHDYEYARDILIKRYSSIDIALESRPANRDLFVGDWSYTGQPLIISEYGGISFKIGESDGWGYSNAVSEEDFAKRYYDVTSSLLESPIVQGFCYTQLTDIEQEINGLLTYNRKPKIDPKIIKSINEGKWNSL